MTREDIERQEGNPDYIEDLCEAILKEVRMDEFSIKYIREKLGLLKSFTDRLHEDCG